MMHTIWIALLLGVFLTAHPALAQPLLRADAVGAGATKAASVTYALRGTLGQPLVGAVQSSSYTVDQGFWPLASPPSAPLVDLTLTPIDPPAPVSIRRGEVLRYRADFAIAPGGPATFEYWAEAVLPNGSVRFLFGPITVNGTPGTTASLTLTQRVPNRAPLGAYTFRMMAGLYPDTAYDADSFPATVIAGARLAHHATTHPAILLGGPPNQYILARSDAEDAVTSAALAPLVPATDARIQALPPTPGTGAVPTMVARRIAAAPEEWWAWNEEGELLLPSLVHEFRAIVQVREEAISGATAQTEATPDAAPASRSGLGGADGEATLSPPFPNPSTGRAAIRFDLPEAGTARLMVYDALGRAVACLVDGLVESGRHTVWFDSASLPSGVYLVRLVTEGRTETQRLTLVR